MKEQDPFVFTPGVLGYPVAFVLLIWVVFWIEVRFGMNFNHLGVYPRTPAGLKGVLFSPLIHGSLKHLFNNSVPLLVLGMSLFYFYRAISWKVLMWGILLSGLLTWAIGRPSYHIGASGIIYVLASFLFFKGIFSRYYRLVALSLIVVFLYGGMLWYVTPVDPQISWEGHLSGLIAGLVLALVYKKQIAAAPKYEWEKEDYDEEDDPFMKHFDENGNFVENIPEEETDEDVQDKESGYRYVYKPNRGED